MEVKYRRICQYFKTGEYNSILKPEIFPKNQYRFSAMCPMQKNDTDSLEKNQYRFSYRFSIKIKLRCIVFVFESRKGLQLTMKPIRNIVIMLLIKVFCFD